MCFSLLDYRVGSTHDDVCLILTDELFSFTNRYVQPITLNIGYSCGVGSNAIVSGWGSTKVNFIVYS